MINLREKLYELADKKYKEFQGGLCPNSDNILGVRMPKLREMAKKISKENGIEFLDEYKPEYYEEKLIYGMVIGYTKMPIEIRLKYLDKFVPIMDNWAVCDGACATYKFTTNNLEDMWEYIQKYINSEKEFEVRFAVVMMMDYYINDEYIDKVLEIYNNISLDKYYVKMGIAWGISEAFVKYEEKTMRFLKSKNNKLDKFTFNKSLQKIIESYRVSDETKNIIRQMKIK